MKATAEPTATTASEIAATMKEERGWVAVYSDLFKARLTLLVLLTTAMGFYLGSRGSVDFVLLTHTILGTALVACGASAFNQLWEREHDGRMHRTQNRPLPSGRMRPGTVLVVGLVTAAAGLGYLVLAVNLATSVLGAISLAIYVFVYTPLKRVTWLNTSVGAIPGGLPPLMGWTAAQGQLSREGWALFGILALWQIPHFLAIAWIYREEYARAGFKMLPVVDPEGERTGRQAVAHTFALLVVSLCPFVTRLAGPAYLAGALVLGLGFLWYAVQFSRNLTNARARQLFYFSLLYLPLLLGVMVLDKVKG
jgi:protoheme IX farnesyltransferase